MAFKIKIVFQSLASVLILIAIFTFAIGFFPHKAFLPGLAEYESLDLDSPPEPPFDKLIFMVVDALRSDFVYSNNSGFEFTQSLISSGAAIPFTAHATSPTITMPRIKAITTGSIPSFLDVILNFAESDTSSTLATQDTWLAQMKAKGTGKMVMYGDDTWLKLFPETFDRADGTSSFFVSDFTEVDNNVTRHVPDELANSDWNTMVLHYLGLDHIGHKAGPRSPNMIPKQEEMDGIVRQVYEAMEIMPHLSSSLLILCGDHGMNDAGNHGGSAVGETSPALVFLSPKLKAVSPGFEAPAPYQDDFQYYQTVEQSDIVPTLGALLGFPVPRNNLGTFIPTFLPFWADDSDQEHLLLRNARQILRIVTATFPSFGGLGPSNDCHESSSTVDELSCKWRSINQAMSESGGQLNGNMWRSEIIKWMAKAQDLMRSTASNYSMPKLVTGQMIAALSLIFSTAAIPFITSSLRTSSTFIAITLSYGLMMFASSYVEEEQQFWYWTNSAWLVLLAVKCIRKAHNLPLLIILFVAMLATSRIARRWNQTGQKFAGELDIAHTFLAKHRLLLWHLVGITYLKNLHGLASSGFARVPRHARVLISTALVAAALTFKVAFTNEDSPELMAGLMTKIADTSMDMSLVNRARIVFAGIGVSLIYTVFTSFNHGSNPSSTLHNLLTLFLITQSRATNIPLFLLFEIQHLILQQLDLTPLEITTTSLLFQYTSYFTFGGSNAISSIDLSSAYNGVSGYNVLAVGILTFVSNWAGPIYWTSATTILLLKSKQKGIKNVLHRHLALLTTFAASSVFFTMAACTQLRTHLFIWTVFSPKYLFMMAWSLAQHLCVNVGLGVLLFWLGSRHL